MSKTVTKEDLKVGMIIYEMQPRFFDYDYHPQEITKINEDTVEVFESGYWPKGRAFTFKISDLFKDSFNEYRDICHY